MKQPAAVQRPMLFPARYAARWDAASRTYRVGLTALERRAGSAA